VDQGGVQVIRSVFSVLSKKVNRVHAVSSIEAKVHHDAESRQLSKTTRFKKFLRTFHSGNSSHIVFNAVNNGIHRIAKRRIRLVRLFEILEAAWDLRDEVIHVHVQ
jgi:hypothetical protein